MAVQHHAELVQTHFMTEAVPVATSKFTALHGALWNGGTFLYVPPRIAVQLPLQALTAHMTASGMEQSHILLIADQQSQVLISQGCTTASWSSTSRLELKSPISRCRTGAVVCGG